MTVIKRVGEFWLQANNEGEFNTRNILSYYVSVFFLVLILDETKVFVEFLFLSLVFARWLQIIQQMSN